jgi:hypothetical protein
LVQPEQELQQSFGFELYTLGGQGAVKIVNFSASKKAFFYMDIELLGLNVIKDQARLLHTLSQARFSCFFGGLNLYVPVWWLYIIL